MSMKKMLEYIPYWIYQDVMHLFFIGDSVFRRNMHAKIVLGWHRFASQ